MNLDTTEQAIKHATLVSCVMTTAVIKSLADCLRTEALTARRAKKIFEVYKITQRFIWVLVNTIEPSRSFLDSRKSCKSIRWLVDALMNKEPEMSGK